MLVGPRLWWRTLPSVCPHSVQLQHKTLTCVLQGALQSGGAAAGRVPELLPDKPLHLAVRERRGDRAELQLPPDPLAPAGGVRRGHPGAQTVRVRVLVRVKADRVRI
eukprot:9168971-Pyramimonas_sp.AAC.1